MSDKNWQCKEGNPFAAAATDERDIKDRLRDHLTMSKFASQGDLIAEMNLHRELAADHIESLERHLAEASKDAERMDYIGSEDFHLVCNINAFWIEWPDGSRQCATHDSPRDAIDEAMKEQA